MTRDEVKHLASLQMWLNGNNPDTFIYVWNAAMEHAAKVAEKTQMTIYTVDDGPSVLHDAAAAIRAEKVDA